MVWPFGNTLLPQLPSGEGSNILALSGDGTTAVGWASDANGNQFAVSWTQGGGIVNLGLLAGGNYSTAQGVSSDGSVIVGFGNDSSNDHAWVWTAADGMVALPVPVGSTYSYAYGVSSDGSTIVGEFGDPSDSSDRACYWAGGNPPIDLGRLPGGAFAWANGANSDGSVIVGLSQTATTQHPFRWTIAGMQDLGEFATDAQGAAAAVSADGSVVVGRANDGTGTAHAFRWTQADGLTDLGVLETGNQSLALGVTGDGNTVVGQVAVLAHPDLWSFIWTQAAGMQALPDGLLDTNSSQAKGELTTGISTDGAITAGYATFPAPAGLTAGANGAYWTLADGHVHLLEKPVAAGSYAVATQVSDNGSIISGYVFDGGTNQFAPAMWTNGVLTLLATTPNVSFAYDVSGDGSTIIGSGAGTVVYWTNAGATVTVLPILPGDDVPTGPVVQLPNIASGNRVCSTDGTKIIGASLHNNFPFDSTETGVVWTNGVITTSLPNSNNSGGVFLEGCSSDGISTIVGWTFDGVTHVPCIWLAGTTQHDLVGGSLQAISCSEDGAVVCLQDAVYVDSLSTITAGTPPLYGVAHTRDTPVSYSGVSVAAFAAENNLIAVGSGMDGSGNIQPIHWNGVTPTILGTGLAGWVAGNALATSGDGSTTVGFYTTADGVLHPVYWDVAGTAHLLDNPYNADASPDHVSRDGTIGVGHVTVPTPPQTGFIFVPGSPVVVHNARPRVVIYF